MLQAIANVVFVQLCSSVQDFNWFKASHGFSVITEPFVLYVLHHVQVQDFLMYSFFVWTTDCCLCIADRQVRQAKRLTNWQ